MSHDNIPEGFGDWSDPHAQQVDVNELVAICKYLYRQCLIDLDREEQAGNQTARVKMGEFVKWCCDKELPRAQTLELRDNHGIRPGAVDAVHNMFNGDPWDCMSSLLPIWPWIAMSDKPPIKSPLRLTSLAITFLFWDQVAVRVETPTEFQPGVPRHEGFIYSLLYDQLTTVLAGLAERGLDVVHDEEGQNIGPVQAVDPQLRRPPKEEQGGGGIFIPGS